MTPRKLPRSLALHAFLAFSLSACTVDGLAIAGLTSGLKAGESPKPGASAAPQVGASTKPGRTPGAQPSGVPGASPSEPGHVDDGHAHPASTAPGTEEGVVAVNPVIGDDVPAVYKKVYGASSMKVEGGFLVVVISGLPDHESPYYTDTEWADKAGTSPAGGFNKAPGSISRVDATYRIPLNPQAAATHESTRAGHMGFALNGVPLFNQYAMGGAPLGNESVSFDQYAGHPAPGGEYHYHVEPLFLTAKFGKDALLGYLLDGFPVYGPEEGGQTVTNADLDVYHGHEHETPDYPTGIYHYHFTAEAPYINGEGYYGTPGTVSKVPSQGGTTGTPPAGGTGTPPSPGTGTPPDGGTGTPPGGGGTGTPPAPGPVAFTLGAGYSAGQLPVKFEFTPPHDTSKVVGTVTFTSIGQPVTASVPLARLNVFVTVNGGTRTSKGTIDLTSSTTAFTLP